MRLISQKHTVDVNYDQVFLIASRNKLGLFTIVAFDYSGHRIATMAEYKRKEDAESAFNGVTSLVSNFFSNGSVYIFPEDESSDEFIMEGDS